MKAFRFMLCIAFFSFLYISAVAQKKTAVPVNKTIAPPTAKPVSKPTVPLSPPAASLMKLIKTSEDMHDDGASLFDTLLPLVTNDRRYHTLINYPGAGSSEISDRSISYSGTNAQVKYSWVARLADAKPYTTSFDSLIEQQKRVVAEVLPFVRDSTVVVDDSYGNYKTITWKAGFSTVIRLEYSTKRPYGLNDNVTLTVETNKTIRKDPSEIIDPMFGRYSENALSATNREAASAWFLSMYARLRQEGLDDKSALEMSAPVFKKLARDGRVAFNVLVRFYRKEDMVAFTGMLTESQKTEVHNIAQKEVADFNAKYDPPKAPEPVIPVPISNMAYTVKNNPVRLTCSYCKGSGVVDHYYYHRYDGIYSTTEWRATVQAKCPHCNGNGYVYWDPK